MASRDDFVAFVRLLIESFGETPPWVNHDIPGFLSALAAAAAQLERFYDTEQEGEQNVRSPSWEAIAGLLFSARCLDPEREIAREPPA